MNIEKRFEDINQVIRRR